MLSADARHDGKELARRYPGPAGRLVSGLDLSFDERLSRFDPGSAVGVQAGGFHLRMTFQMTGAIPNGFHASGECRRNKHPRFVHSDQIQQPPIFLSRPLASTMPGHVATLFLPA
jgi:hypothetical protein